MEQINSESHVENPDHRDCTAKSFFLLVEDLLPDEHRDIERTLLKVLDHVNRHPRSANVFSYEVLIFSSEPANKHAAYIQVEEPHKRGFNRQYFS